MHVQTVWLLFTSVSTATFVKYRQANTTITNCLTAANIPQNLPGTSNFFQAIEPFNLRLPFTPVAVAVPTTVAQVQAAVSCGASLGLYVSPKSGGHSYASHGLGGEDGHLMVDMKYFYNVTLDNSTGIATIGPGARLGNVATALWDQGERAISHGSCPGVGVGGHVLHGGYGFASHTYGLALDNLVSATVVLADSSVVTASNATNPDLFWGLQGAGQSYGIVTSFDFQTFAAPDSNIVFQYVFFWSQAQARAAFATLQDYANTTMSTPMNMRLYINSFVFSLSGVYYGNQTTFENEIKPLLALLGGSPFSSSVQTMGWLDTLTAYANGDLTTPLDYDLHETFFAKSLMTVNVSGPAMDAFWEYWATTAKAVSRDWYLIVDLHGGPTSAVSAVPIDSTSYVHRPALFKYEFYDRVDSGTYPLNGFSFLDGWVDAITRTMNTTTFGMYINYADPTLNATQAHTAYWLQHYDRLVSIKQTWDPDRVFENPQAVLST